MARRNGTLAPSLNVPEIATSLQRLQRQRAVILKSRNMQSNRLQAVVAGQLGYSASMKGSDRQAKFKEAATLIDEIEEGGHEDFVFVMVVRTTLIGIRAFELEKLRLEKLMIPLARQLPVARWVAQPEQRGFGELQLAQVVGEAGDLAHYENPGKLWRRLGCAPWTFQGKTLMGATWRSGKEGKLPAEEWEAFGYSPRRRSIAYLIGEGLVKQNGEGPYRARYDSAKADLQRLYPEYPKQRCHRHGMLLATKMLLRELWVAWGHRPCRRWEESARQDL